MITWKKNDKCYIVGKDNIIHTINCIDRVGKSALVEPIDGGELEWVGLEKVRNRPLRIAFKRVSANEVRNES